MALLSQYKFTLASKSPRRQELLAQVGIDFSIEVNKDEKEAYSASLPHFEVPEFLARHKSETFHRHLSYNEILITADTLVFCPNASPTQLTDTKDIINNSFILGKPKGRSEAIEIITHLSGKTHYVLTGVVLRSHNETRSFTVVSEVTFRAMSLSEIEYYVDNYSPYDKAGAYGVQEWIGFVAITSIKGSYCNVMGLPVAQLKEEILKMCDHNC